MEILNEIMENYVQSDAAIIFFKAKCGNFHFWNEISKLRIFQFFFFGSSS